MLSFNLGRNTTAAALAITITLAGGCSTTTKSIPYVATPVGTTWSGQQTSSGRFGSGTSQVTTRAGERMWEGQRVLTHESAAGTMLFRAADGFALASSGLTASHSSCCRLRSAHSFRSPQARPGKRAQP